MSEKLPRVLFATYPWAFETLGGGEIQMLEYERHGPDLGYVVDRLNPWAQNFTDIDLVHVFSCMPGLFPFCKYIRSRGKPLIISSSLWLSDKTVGHYQLNEIRQLLELADKIVPNSQLEAENLSRFLGIGLSSFRVVRNGCSDTFLEHASENIFRSHFGLTEPFLLCVANVERRKNQVSLIRAAVQLKMRLVLAGHIREEDYWAECHPIPGFKQYVSYVGPIPHGGELMKSAYAGCLAFVLPSTLETPGLAAIEAFVSGAPVIVTQEGSAEEYFGQYAEYVDPENLDEIIKAILKVSSKRAAYLPNQSLAKQMLWSSQLQSLRNLYVEMSERY